MRVSIFFDGKNFYAGWRDSESHVDRIDFAALANWLVAEANGEVLAGAYYYTGVETGPQGQARPGPGRPGGGAGRNGLNRFLDMLDLVPGFFVKRFPRRQSSFTCYECGAKNTFTQEKEVDTTMVADMLRLSAVNAFDVMVLVSGDADHAPAAEGVRALGKQLYVATWGAHRLSGRLRKLAFDHIDLNDGAEEFRLRADLEPAPFRERAEPDEVDDEAMQEAFLRELSRAEQKLRDGYVGASYFVTRWRSDMLSARPVVRQRILDQLVADQRVEIYEAQDGNKALRILEEPAEEEL